MLFEVEIQKMLGCYYCFVIPINNRSQCCSNNRFAFNCLDFPVCKFISFRWVSWQMPVTSTDPVGSLFKGHIFCYLKFLWKHCCVMYFFLEQKHGMARLGVRVNKMIELSTFYKIYSLNVLMIIIPGCPGKSINQNLPML